MKKKTKVGKNCEFSIYIFKNLNVFFCLADGTTKKEEGRSQGNKSWDLKSSNGKLEKYGE
jgi:hypothetical protein